MHSVPITTIVVSSNPTHGEDDVTFNTKLNTNKYKFLFTNELEVVFIWNKHTAKIDCYGNSCMAILIFYTPVSRRAVLYDWVCQAGDEDNL
jgi:hypothetical protein